MMEPDLYITQGYIREMLYDKKGRKLADKNTLASVFRPKYAALGILEKSVNNLCEGGRKHYNRKNSHKGVGECRLKCSEVTRATSFKPPAIL